MNSVLGCYSDLAPNKEERVREILNKASKVAEDINNLLLVTPPSNLDVKDTPPSQALPRTTSDIVIRRLLFGVLFLVIAAAIGALFIAPVAGPLVVGGILAAGKAIGLIAAATTATAATPFIMGGIAAGIIFVPALFVSIAMAAKEYGANKKAIANFGSSFVIQADNNNVLHDPLDSKKEEQTSSNNIIAEKLNHKDNSEIEITENTSNITTPPLTLGNGGKEDKEDKEKDDSTYKPNNN